jgi:hypothetical protein
LPTHTNTRTHTQAHTHPHNTRFERAAISTKARGAEAHLQLSAEFDNAAANGAAPENFHRFRSGNVANSHQHLVSLAHAHPLRSKVHTRATLHARARTHASTSTPPSNKAPGAFNAHLGIERQFCGARSNRRRVGLLCINNGTLRTRVCNYRHNTPTLSKLNHTHTHKHTLSLTHTHLALIQRNIFPGLSHRGHLGARVLPRQRHERAPRYGLPISGATLLKHCTHTTHKARSSMRHVQDSHSLRLQQPAQQPIPQLLHRGPVSARPLQ